MKHLSRLQWLLIGLALLTLAWLVRLLTREMGFGDANYYLATAQHVGEFTRSPHGYRLLVPYLAAFIAHLTTASLPDAFLFLTLLAFVGVNLTLIFWFHRLVSLPLRTAILLSLLYVFSYAGVYNLHNSTHVGYWEHWFLLVGFIAIYADAFWVLAAVVLIGAWIKETVVLLLPLYFVLTWRARGLRASLVTGSILAAVFLAVFLFLRSGIVLEGANGFSSYSGYYTIEYLQFIASVWLKRNPIQEIYLAFQFLWVLAFFGWFRAPTRVRWMALLVPLAVSQILLAADIQRMTVTAFPAILLLSGYFLKELEFSEQVWISTLNPLLFLSYNLYPRYLVLISGWVMLWVVLWYVSGTVLKNNTLLPRIVRPLPIPTGYVFRAAAVMTVGGTVALMRLDTLLPFAGFLALAAALCGVALGVWTMIARRIAPFSLSA